MSNAQELMDALAGFLNREDVGDYPPHFDGELLATATANARLLVRALEEYSANDSAHGARMASNVAPWLGDLGGLHYAVGAYPVGDELLSYAERFSLRERNKEKYRAGRDDRASFIVLCRAAYLERSGRGEEADALVARLTPTVRNAVLRGIFEHY